MEWRKKKKEPTHEEALALAKQQLEPFWLGSPPLLAGINSPEGAKVYPLEPAFLKKNWILILMDPTHLSRNGLFPFVRDMFKRYASFNVSPLVIFYPIYRYYAERAVLDGVVRRYSFGFPIALDVDGSLFRSFAVTDPPKVILLKGGESVYERSGRQWMEGVENTVQLLLRSTDPGLPLLPLLPVPLSLPFQSSRAEFGWNRGVEFPLPGFGAPVNGVASAVLNGETQCKLMGGRFFIKGKWQQDQERIFTSDPEAEITFHATDKRVAVIARSLGQKQEVTKLTVRANGIIVPEDFRGRDLQYDDEGGTHVRVDTPRVYYILEGLDAKTREITFRFPSAARQPIALYGLRFGEG